LFDNSAARNYNINSLAVYYPKPDILLIFIKGVKSMGKTKRGRNIKADGWRGTCPLCARTGVKLLWEKAADGGAKLKVCKKCGA